MDQFGASAEVTQWEAEGGTITADGVFTAGNQPGPARMRAVVAGYGPVERTIRINAAPRIVQAQLSPSPATGTTAQFTVVVEDDDDLSQVIAVWAAPQDATWITLNDNGKPAGNMPVTFSRSGVTTMTLEVRDPWGLTATTMVPVAVAATPTVVTVTPAAPVVQAGSEQEFQVGVRDQFGIAIAAPSVEWHTTIGTLTGGGSTVAFLGTESGSGTITATAGPVTGTAAVRVNTTPVINGITLSPDPIRGFEGRMTATVTDDLPAEQTQLIWSVAGSPDAAVAIPQADGRSAILTCTAIGSYQVRVEAVDGDGARASTEQAVTVVASASAITVSATPIDGEPPGRQQFTAEVLDQFGASLTVTGMTWTVTGPGTIDADGIYTPAQDGSGAAVVTAAIPGSPLTTSMTVPGTSGPGTDDGQPPTPPTAAVMTVTTGLSGIRNGLVAGKPAGFSNEKSITVRVVAVSSAPLLRVDVVGASGTASDGDPGLITLTDPPEGTLHLGAVVTVGSATASASATFDDLLTVVVDRTPPEIVQSSAGGSDIAVDEVIKLNANTEAKCATLRSQGLRCYPADKHQEDITVVDSGSGLDAVVPVVRVRKGTADGTRIGSTRWKAGADPTQPTNPRIMLAERWGSVPDTTTYDGMRLSSDSALADVVVEMKDRCGNVTTAVGHKMSIKKTLPVGRMAALGYQQETTLSDLGTELKSGEKNSYPWYSPTSLLRTSVDVWQVGSAKGCAGLEVSADNLVSSVVWVVPATGATLAAVDAHGNRAEWQIESETTLDLSSLADQEPPAAGEIVRAQITAHSTSTANHSWGSGSSTYSRSGELGWWGVPGKEVRHPVSPLEGLAFQPLDGLVGKWMAVQDTPTAAPASVSSGYETVLASASEPTPAGSAEEDSDWRPWSMPLTAGALLSGLRNAETGEPSVYWWSPGTGHDTGWYFNPAWSDIDWTGNGEEAYYWDGWMGGWYWWYGTMITGSEEVASSSSYNGRYYSYTGNTTWTLNDGTPPTVHQHSTWTENGVTTSGEYDYNMANYWGNEYYALYRVDETGAPEQWSGHASYVVGNPGTQGVLARVLLPQVLTDKNNDAEVIWKQLGHQDVTSHAVYPRGFDTAIAIATESTDTDKGFAMLRGVVPPGSLRMTYAFERAWKHQLTRGGGSKVGSFTYEGSFSHIGDDIASAVAHASFIYGGDLLEPIDKEVVASVGTETMATGFGAIQSTGLRQNMVLVGQQGILRLEGSAPRIAAIVDDEGNDVMGTGDERIQILTNESLLHPAWEDPAELVRTRYDVKLVVGAKVKPALYHVDLDLGADPANAEQLDELGLKIRSGVYRVKDALAVIRYGYETEAEQNATSITKSHSVPKVQVSGWSTSSVQLSGDDIVIGLTGRVDDKSAGIVASPGLKSIYVNHNGACLGSLPLQRVADATNKFAPYACHFQFAGTVRIPKTSGVHTLELVTNLNDVGESGRAEADFAINAVLPADDSGAGYITVGATFPAGLSATAADVVTLLVPNLVVGMPATTITLNETGVDTGIFQDASASTVLTLADTTAFDAEVVDVVYGSLVLGGETYDDINMAETAVGSQSFLLSLPATAIGGTMPEPVWSVASVGPMKTLGDSDGWGWQPYLIKLEGPKDIVEQLVSEKRATHNGRVLKMTKVGEVYYATGFDVSGGGVVAVAAAGAGGVVAAGAGGEEPELYVDPQVVPTLVSPMSRTATYYRLTAKKPGEGMADSTWFNSVGGFNAFKGDVGGSEVHVWLDTTRLGDPNAESLPVTMQLADHGGAGVSVRISINGVDGVAEGVYSRNRDGAGSCRVSGRNFDAIVALKEGLVFGVDANGTVKRTKIAEMPSLTEKSVVQWPAASKDWEWASNSVDGQYAEPGWVWNPDGISYLPEARIPLWSLPQGSDGVKTLPQALKEYFGVTDADLDPTATDALKVRKRAVFNAFVIEVQRGTINHWGVRLINGTPLVKDVFDWLVNEKVKCYEAADVTADAAKPDGQRLGIKVGQIKKEFMRWPGYVDLRALVTGYAGQEQISRAESERYIHLVGDLWIDTDKRVVDAAAQTTALLSGIADPFTYVSYITGGEGVQIPQDGEGTWSGVAFDGVMLVADRLLLGAGKVASKGLKMTLKWGGATKPGIAVKEGFEAVGDVTNASFNKMYAAVKGGMCFVAGTKVKTADGWKAIEQVMAGDRVWSRNAATGEEGLRSVTETFVTYPNALVHLRYTRAGHQRGGGGSEGDEEAEIVGTPEHPFWVVEKSAFVPMGQLKVGYHLALAGGMNAEVSSARVETLPEGFGVTTYNFSVEGWNTYFAAGSGSGQDYVWVHNLGELCEEAIRKAQDIWKRKGKRMFDFAPFKNFTYSQKYVTISGDTKLMRPVKNVRFDLAATKPQIRADEWVDKKIEYRFTDAYVKESGVSQNVIILKENGHPDFTPFLYRGAKPSSTRIPLNKAVIREADRVKYGEAEAWEKARSRASKQDIADAWEKAGYTTQEVKMLKDRYTWHHSEDLGKMELVEKAAHNAFLPHTGGRAIFETLLEHDLVPAGLIKP
jgi:hypothetical protein